MIVSDSLELITGELEQSTDVTPPLMFTNVRFGKCLSQELSNCGSELKNLIRHETVQPPQRTSNGLRHMAGEFPVIASVERQLIVTLKATEQSS